MTAWGSNLDRKFWRPVGGPDGVWVVLRTVCCPPSYSSASASELLEGAGTQPGDLGGAGETPQLPGGGRRALPGPGARGSGS